MSSRQPLEVVEGLSSPLRIEDAPTQVTKPEVVRPAVRELPPGSVEYHSMTAGLWLLLADGNKRRDPDTGYEYVVPAVTLQFKQGIAITADPEKIHRAEGCKKGCDLHPRGIPKHPGFGLGQTFWRAEDARSAAVRRQEESDIERLKANPEQAARLLKQLQAAGFDLAPRKTKQE